MDQRTSLNFSIANILRESKPAFKGSVISLPFCAPPEPTSILSPTDRPDVLLAANFATFPLFNVPARAACLPCPFSLICGSEATRGKSPRGFLYL